MTPQERRMLISLLIDELCDEDREELCATLRGAVTPSRYLQLKEDATRMVAIRNDMDERMQQFRDR